MAHRPVVVWMSAWARWSPSRRAAAIAISCVASQSSQRAWDSKTLASSQGSCQAGTSNPAAPARLTSRISTGYSRSNQSSAAARVGTGSGWTPAASGGVSAGSCRPFRASSAAAAVAW